MQITLTNKEAMVVYSALFMYIRNLSKITPFARSNQDKEEIDIAEHVAEQIKHERESST